MAWVRFPDGSRRKVERVAKADAERDLSELLAARSQAGAAAPPSRLRLATFNDVLDAWVAAESVTDAQPWPWSSASGAR
jgi:hypothetical protein